MTVSELPVPDFTDAKQIRRSAETWGFRHDLAGLRSESISWRQKHAILPAHRDRKKITLLGIDLQRDFCHPEGTLFVAGPSGSGAIGDGVRLTEFIYRNLNRISDIKLTLDTHTLFQIFFAPFWETAEGGHLSEHTLIALSGCGNHLVNLDASGKILHQNVRPIEAAALWLKNGDREWLRKQVLFYCRKLADAGKHTLYLWPPHCIAGTEGHAVSGVILEAVMFHNLVRMSEPHMYHKGEPLLTENYDPAEAEVAGAWDGQTPVSGPRDSGFYEEVAGTSALIVAGQAKSHCVLSMLRGLVREAKAKDPSQLKKIYVLTDCMSPVTVRDLEGRMIKDFTRETDVAFETFKDEGIHLVKSCDPMAEWPVF